MTEAGRPVPLPPGSIEDLFLIRHAESEGNAAARLPPSHDYAALVQRRPHWIWRLTSEGVRQAAAAGAWIRAELAQRLPDTLAVTSPHLRAMETAAMLGLPELDWEIEPDAREREWGDWENRDPGFHARELGRQSEHPFDWAPPAGESMAMLVRRVSLPLNRILATPSSAAVVVTHADTLWAFSYLAAGLDPSSWRAQYVAEPQTPNCGIIHYSRRNPDTGELLARFAWHRTYCPWRDPAGEAMTPLTPRRRYSAQQLLAQVNIVDCLQAES
ncbi:histidine phosphatase family protein [Streptomyces sp. NPDC016309]|uniref:histidine phosphatase family protein n=1 Tax=Streptomyces sp. NPDC016309 TaxID=3364965 RepID=UPI0036F4CC3A